MDKIPKRVELLSPAGSREAFEGALSAGADAVYLGGERFGARAYADNFSTEEIVRAIREAHILNRKVYLTANVLTRETEMEDLVRFVQVLYEAGLDGVIVQDIGILAALSAQCPGLPLHASTQLSVTSPEAVQYLRRFGVRRVVPARELSLEEIRLLRQEDLQWVRTGKGQDPAAEPSGFESSAAEPFDAEPVEPIEAEPIEAEPIEIEAFIHGAMCYSYSGRCLMSSFLGGRSGNRGRCAGTCRLPYRILDADGHRAGPDAGKKEVYPLSMKDLCVLSILPELIDAGITSFKIEGRMKQPVYAAGVTAIYRKYIDRCYAWTGAGRREPWRVEEEDLKKLHALYIRTSLGTGYYHAKNGRNLVTIGKPGYAGTDPGLEKEIRQKYLSGLPRKQIAGRAVFRIGEPARLFVRTEEAAEGAGRQSASCEGPVVQAAEGRPLEPEAIRARLQKTGGSLFAFSSLELEADENVFLPVSAVNALRRDTLQRLEDLLAGRHGNRAEAAAAGNDPVSAASADNNPVSASAKECGSVSGTGKSAGIYQAQEPSALQRQLWALVSTPAQLQAAQDAGCACIIIDGGFSPDPHKSAPAFIQYFRALPPVFRVSYREKLRKQILEAEKSGFSGVLVRTLEELVLVKQTGYRGQIIADASLYAWNGRSMAALARDCHRIITPLELEEKGIRSAALSAGPLLSSCTSENKSTGEGMLCMQERLVLPVYGRIPMMESAGCIRKTENLCSRDKKTGKGEPDSFWYLEDRMGKHLPVRCRCAECSNTVYNAVPLSLHQFAGRGLCREIPVHLCMFTTESGQETSDVLHFFHSLMDNKEGRVPGSVSGSNKKAGSRGARPAANTPFREYTNGHFRTGAL